MEVSDELFVAYPNVAGFSPEFVEHPMTVRDSGLPGLFVAADFHHFGDEDLSGFASDLSPLFWVATSPLRQYSELAPAKLVIEFIPTVMSLVIGVSAGLVAEAIERRFLRPKPSPPTMVIFKERLSAHHQRQFIVETNDPEVVREAILAIRMLSAVEDPDLIAVYNSEGRSWDTNQAKGPEPHPETS